MINQIYYAVIRDDQVEYCKGTSHLCELLLEGFTPIGFSENLQKLFDLMADYY